MRIPRKGIAVLAVCALCTTLGMVAWSASASADQIYFTFAGGSQPVSGALDTGYYNVAFLQGPGSGTVSGAIERSGVIIATAPPFMPAPGTHGGESVLDASLQPGDVARLSDTKVAGGLTATFTGYPTVVSAQCGATTISGATAPGQPVVYARYDLGFGSPGKIGSIVNASGGYTVTFAAPIPPGATLYVQSFYSQLEPMLEVQTEFQARATGPCLETPPPPPPSSIAKCVVPNLGHKTLARAKQLLARAHCKLGKVAKPSKHAKKRRNHKLAVVSQKPGAKRIMVAGSKVNVRLG
jgi:hypothetical protein